MTPTTTTTRLWGGLLSTRSNSCIPTESRCHHPLLHHVKLYLLRQNKNMGQCGRIVIHDSHIAYSPSQLLVQNPIPKLDCLSLCHPLGNCNQPSHTSVCFAKTLTILSFKLLKTPQLLCLHPLVVLLQLQEELRDRVKQRWGNNMCARTRSRWCCNITTSNTTMSNRYIGWRPMLLPLLNLSSMISPKLMIIIHQRILQVLKQSLPCQKGWEQSSVMQHLHITPRIKLLNEVL